jgi:hypothetical protein
MPKFLTTQDVYRLLQRELPEGAYPDGASSAFFSTADMASISDAVSAAYSNQETIYNNQFPQYADERITDWEITAFQYPLDASLSLSERRDRVITKLRSKKGITRQDMKDAVLSIIGSDKIVTIFPWNSRDPVYGAWRLGESELGYNTYLGAGNSMIHVGDECCSLSASDLGMTEQQLLNARRQAYTYEVKIFNYTPTDAELAAIDAALSVAEAARDSHFINSNQQIIDGYFGFDGGVEGIAGFDFGSFES